MLLHQVKMAEAGDIDGSGDNKVVAASEASMQQIELLTKSVGLLAEGLQKMEGNQQNIVSALANITSQSKGAVREELKEEFGKDVDLEQLDRKDFAAFIIKSAEVVLKTEMAKLLGDVDKKVTNLASSFESKNANEQIAKAADQNPDFWEWSNEIKQMLAENPTLSVNRAYQLAKSENHKKAEELNKKYAKPTEKKEQSFLGLTPTSSIGTRDATGKMTQKEAAEKAFDKVMGDLGDVIQNKDFKIA